jgi:hypothetical protein
LPADAGAPPRDAPAAAEIAPPLPPWAPASLAGVPFWEPSAQATTAAIKLAVATLTLAKES